MNLLSLILMISILGSKFKEGKNQLINGFLALQLDFNYHASIIGDLIYICSGGIIDTTHLITAAHCVENYQPYELTIVAGVVNLGNSARVLRHVENIYIPADFYNYRRSNDIAVLKLYQPFVFGSNIGAISLPSVPVSNNSTVCWLTGLDKNESIVYEWKLSWTPLKIISHSVCECITTIYQLSSRVFCAIDIRETSQPTPGDSGGILVCDGIAVGILSGRIEDMPFTPNIFCSIYGHIDFIRTTINLTDD